MRTHNIGEEINDWGGMDCSLTDEAVEFENEEVGVQDFRNTRHHFRGMYGTCPNLIKEGRKLSTCNRLSLESVACPPIMPKNLNGR